MKVNWLVLVSLAVCFACTASKNAGQTDSSAIPLFNGKYLSGWTAHGKEKWYVENGELVCESGPLEGYGYLSTDSVFTDFDLTLEFKQEATGNSGVFFRSSIDETVKITGWQAEIAPKGQHTGGIYESYGRGWLIQPTAALDHVLRENDWNTFRIRCVGKEVKTWLNGILMVTLEDEKMGKASGKIALQIHDGGGIKVRWRNINIAALEPKSTTDGK